MTAAHGPAEAPIASPLPAHPGNPNPQASGRLSRARRSSTAPELALRRILHARGLRFRVEYPVPGAPRRSIDVAFTRARLAIFIDGCFWHGCPEHGTQPKNNSSWWSEKFQANQRRDADTNRLLRNVGWTVLRVWEHENPHDVAAQVQSYLMTAAEQNDPATGRARPNDRSRTGDGGAPAQAR